MSLRLAPMPPEPDLPLSASSSLAVSPEARLAVAYADTRADELSFALDLPAQPALRALELDLAGVALDLRILGYSHQVVITAGGPEPLLTETVARLPRAGSGVSALPAFHEDRRDAGPAGIIRYSIATSVTSLGDDRADVEALISELDRTKRAVLGVFPGHPHAFTGLRVDPVAPGGVQWRSWHAYPGAGQLVQTRSRLVRDPA